MTDNNNNGNGKEIQKNKSPSPKFDFSEVENVLINGDISKMNEMDRVSYVRKVCESLGLNPLTRPFDYLTLSGKVTLYAKKDATDQLRKIHDISIKITSREEINGVFIVTAQAITREGRYDESIGAVNVQGLKGDQLANAMMKSETKARRRVTLSICGLGILDDSETDTIPGARKTWDFNSHNVAISHEKPSEPKVESASVEVRQKMLEAARLADIDMSELQVMVHHRYGVKASKEMTKSQCEELTGVIQAQAKEKPDEFFRTGRPVPAHEIPGL